jgi:GTP-binding protein YchF
MAENVLMRVEKQLKTKKELQVVYDIMKRIEKQLSQNLPVSGLEFSKEELIELRPYPFLTIKKMIYVANVSEVDLPEMRNSYVEAVEAHAQREGNTVVVICAKIEEEIAQLDQAERKDFLETLGLEESGLDRLVKASFKLLGLITFLTAGPMEARAWTIKQGTSAVEAAAEIHTDISKGFVRAEVVKFDDFDRCGGRNEAKEKGLVKSEGKEYVMQDGDVVLFLHH